MIYAGPSSSLADPLGSGPVIRAVEWLEGTLLGTIATTVAIVAVATIGIMMLTGRIEIRRAATVVIGCFILFGAPTIVAGLQAAIRDSGGGIAVAQMEATPPVVIPPPRPRPADPYAGASLAPQ